MSITYLLQWWYGAGWRRQVTLISVRVKRIGKAFSGGILIKTLFSPWKRLVTGTDRNSTLGDKLRAALDNVVSRFVGFMVRSITLFTALITIVAVFFINLIIIIIWPIVPIAPFLCVIGWLFV
jgi:hypothetical protein